MKTLTLVLALIIVTLTANASVFVTTHGKQIRLTPTQLTWLRANGTPAVKAALKYDSNNIRNNEVADQIFYLLKK